MLKNLLIVTNIILVVVVSGYFMVGVKERKTAFILNQRVFESFNGKIELEQKLTSARQEGKKRLDSLLQLPFNENTIKHYEEENRRLEVMLSDLSEKYSADIWKRINEDISSYGEAEGYDFIFGAAGDGNLIYASRAHDVTEDVILYINNKYKNDD